MSSDSNMVDVLAGTLGLLFVSFLMFIGVAFWLYNASNSMPELPKKLKVNEVFLLEDLKIIDSKHFKQGKLDIYFDENFPLAEYKDKLYAIKSDYGQQYVCINDYYEQKNCMLIKSITGF